MRVRLGSRVLLLRNLVLCFRSSIVGCNAELVSSLKCICPKLRSRPFSRNWKNSIVCTILTASTLLIGDLKFATRLRVLSIKDYLVVMLLSRRSGVKILLWTIFSLILLIILVQNIVKISPLILSGRLVLILHCIVSDIFTASSSLRHRRRYQHRRVTMASALWLSPSIWYSIWTSNSCSSSVI